MADREAIMYHTGKVTVPREYRQLVMKYDEISDAIKGWLFIFPTVLVKMKNGKEYRKAFVKDKFIPKAQNNL